MILRIKKENLREGVAIAERISSRSLSLPILKNIIIRAQKNLINISSTDLEIGLNWWALAKVEEEGEVVIPASILSNFLGFLPDEIVTLSSSDNNLKIECGDYKTEINGFSSEEFPLIPKISEKRSISINSLELCKALSQVVDIPSTSNTRPEISGIFFNFTDKELKIVATDSYRLGEKKIKVNQEGVFSFILPQKAAKEVINIFSNKDTELKILIGANQILFESSLSETKKPEINLISRQIDGEYPNYEEIIPKKNKIKATLNRVDLINQLKAAGIFSGRSNEINLEIKPDKIELSSQSSESGDYKSSLLGKIEGGKEKVVFNYRYLIDGLSKIEDKEITFEINSSGEPAVFKSSRRDDFLYIVMPIKA